MGPLLFRSIYVTHRNDWVPSPRQSVALGVLLPSSGDYCFKPVLVAWSALGWCDGMVVVIDDDGGAAGRLGGDDIGGGGEGGVGVKCDLRLNYSCRSWQFAGEKILPTELQVARMQQYHSNIQAVSTLWYYTLVYYLPQIYMVQGIVWMLRSFVYTYSCASVCIFKYVSCSTCRQPANISYMIHTWYIRSKSSLAILRPQETRKLFGRPHWLVPEPYFIL